MSNKINYVIYTDGSARPTNPGPCGAGFHGYSYEDKGEPEKTKNKPAKVCVTNQGYKTQEEFKMLTSIGGKESKTYEVNPISYHEYFGTPSVISTNNVGEVLAIIKALEYISDKDNVGKISIFADSKISINILKDCINPNGRESAVTLNGKDLQSDMKGIYRVIKDMGITVEVEHIYGHSGDFGNEHSDVMAKMGSQYFITHRKEKEVFKDIEPKDMWKSYSSERNAHLGFKRILFKSNDAYDISRLNPNVNVYPGTNVKDISEAGKPASESSYTIAVLSEPDALIEMAKNQFSSEMKTRSVIAGINVENIYKNYRWIRDYDTDCLSKHKHKNIISVNNNTFFSSVVANEINPPGLANKAMDRYVPLFPKLIDCMVGVKDNAFKDGILDKGANIYIDVTHLFYDYDEAKDKYKLKDAIYKDGVNPIFNHETDKHTFKIVMMQGLDVMPKINLKKIESKNPRVYLFLENGVNKLDYGTITASLADNNISIWQSSNTCRVYGLKK